MTAKPHWDTPPLLLLPCLLPLLPLPLSPLLLIIFISGFSTPAFTKLFLLQLHLFLFVFLNSLLPFLSFAPVSRLLISILTSSPPVRSDSHYDIFIDPRRAVHLQLYPYLQPHNPESMFCVKDTEQQTKPCLKENNINVKIHRRTDTDVGLFCSVHSHTLFIHVLFGSNCEKATVWILFFSFFK